MRIGDIRPKKMITFDVIKFDVNHVTFYVRTFKASEGTSE